jgi:hypothetical protein
LTFRAYACKIDFSTYNDFINKEDIMPPRPEQWNSPREPKPPIGNARAMQGTEIYKFVEEAQTRIEKIREALGADEDGEKLTIAGKDVPMTRFVPTGETHLWPGHEDEGTWEEMVAVVCADGLDYTQVDGAGNVFTGWTEELVIRYRNVSSGEMTGVFRWCQFEKMREFGAPDFHHAQLLRSERGEAEPSIPVTDPNDPIFADIANKILDLEEAAGLTVYQQPDPQTDDGELNVGGGSAQAS